MRSFFALFSRTLVKGTALVITSSICLLFLSSCGEFPNIGNTTQDPAPVLRFKQPFLGVCSAKQNDSGKRVLTIYNLTISFFDYDKDLSEVEYIIYIIEDSDDPSRENEELLSGTRDYSIEVSGKREGEINFFLSDILISPSITKLHIDITLVDEKNNRSKTSGIECSIEDLTSGLAENNSASENSETEINSENDTTTETETFSDRSRSK